MSRQADMERELAELKRRLYELERSSWEVLADDPLPSAGALQVVVCRVEDSRVALPLDAVERAVPAAAMAPLPEAPPWVQGLLIVRGQALPVLDVAARLGRCRRELELSDQIVLCQADQRRFGLVVQEVLGVRSFAASEAAAARQAASMPQGPYVRATLHDADGLVLLFSLRRLLATSDIPAGDDAAGGGPARASSEA
ncbi:chemotaxis protein CheW [Sorangium sp. So ce131]|uniref:chemotaxis protein CheW n=1 Tax=Sorangium sp. So ce131 TaxID=3133282 RepID=UPI003F5F456D